MVHVADTNRKKSFPQSHESGTNFMKSPFICVIVTLLVLQISGLSFGQSNEPVKNWTRFRGADATGVVADDPRLPDK